MEPTEIVADAAVRLRVATERVSFSYSPLSLVRSTEEDARTKSPRETTTA